MKEILNMRKSIYVRFQRCYKSYHYNNELIRTCLPLFSLLPNVGNKEPNQELTTRGGAQHS